MTCTQKLEIVKLINSDEMNRTVGKHSGIDKSMVKGIYQKREHIKKYMKVAAYLAASQALCSSSHHVSNSSLSTEKCNKKLE